VRTRTRFAILFACLAATVTAVGVASIYGAVGRSTAARPPAEAEKLLEDAARRAIEDRGGEGKRLEEATKSLLEARSLLAENRILAKDAVVGLAIEIAAILAAVMAAATIAFFLLSRLITRGLDELAAGAALARGDRSRRFPSFDDPDLDATARALNELMDLASEQERRLAEAARLEGWREVASFLAHQLKNPLAALRIAAQNGELSLGSSESKALALESFGIVLAEAKRLAALIDRFRDLAPSGLESYNASGVTDLAELVPACAARAEVAGARVSVPDASALPAVSGDPSLLEQALWNLFANSIEAGRDRGAGSGAAAGAASGGLEISVASRVEGGEAVLLVTDSNAGIDPALVPRLGRERVTTKAEGTGLGLILVRRILGAQGGSLELFATERGGLGARVRLPLAGRIA
jgi:signal transduction histidine kinase